MINNDRVKEIEKKIGKKEGQIKLKGAHKMR